MNLTVDKININGAVYQIDGIPSVSIAEAEDKCNKSDNGIYRVIQSDIVHNVIGILFVYSVETQTSLYIAQTYIGPYKLAKGIIPNSDHIRFTYLETFSNPNLLKDKVCIQDRKYVSGAWTNWTESIQDTQVATDNVVGGIKTGYTENGNNYAVKLQDGVAYVTVPEGLCASDLSVTINNIPFSFGDDGDCVVSIPSATANDYGVIKVKQALQDAITPIDITGQTAKYYEVELNTDGKAVVNVPWTNTSSAATWDTLGNIKADPAGTVTLFESDPVDDHKYYKLKINNDGLGFVNLPSGIFGDPNNDGFTAIKVDSTANQLTSSANPTLYIAGGYGITTSISSSAVIDNPGSENPVSHNGIVISLDAASHSALGGIKIADLYGETPNAIIQAENTASTALVGAPLKLSSATGYVNVAYISRADNNKYGVIRTNYPTSDIDRNYKVQVNENGDAFVNVPWESSTTTLIGLIGSNAIGNANTPIYWNGSSFATASVSSSGDTPIEDGSLLNSNNLAQPNIYYRWQNAIVNSTSIILAPPTSSTKVCQYIFRFKTGATIPTISFSVLGATNPFVIADNLPTLEDNAEYEIDIVYDGSKYIVSAIKLEAVNGNITFSAQPI